MARRIGGTTMASNYLEAGAFFAFLCSLIFIGRYTKIAPWWRNEVGLGMVSLSFAMTILLLPQIIHYVTGLNLNNPFFLWYYIGSFIVSGIIELWRTWTINRIHQHGEKQKEYEDEHDQNLL